MLFVQPSTQHILKETTGTVFHCSYVWWTILHTEEDGVGWNDERQESQRLRSDLEILISAIMAVAEFKFTAAGVKL